MEVSSRTFALSCPVNWFEVIDVSFASLSAQDTIILELMDMWTRCVSDSPKDYFVIASSLIYFLPFFTTSHDDIDDPLTTTRVYD